MLRKRLPLVAAACLLVAVAAGAETDAGAAAAEAAAALEAEAGPRLEVTLFLGLLASDSLAAPVPKLDLDEDVDFGLVLGLPTSFDDFRAEIIYSRNEMELTAVQPGRPLLAVIQQQYLHLGGLWELGEGRQRGFATASVGVADLDPRGSVYSSETLPSVSVGGGGKLFVSDRVGIRLEGRILGHVGDASMFCDPDGDCLGRVSGSLLVQFQAAAGLMVSF